MRAPSPLAASFASVARSQIHAFAAAVDAVLELREAADRVRRPRDVDNRRRKGQD